MMGSFDWRDLMTLTEILYLEAQPSLGGRQSFRRYKNARHYFTYSDTPSATNCYTENVPRTRGQSELQNLPFKTSILT